MQQGTLLAERYLLERRAGAGGMGEVWKAVDQETGQPVALKTLPGREPDHAARFAREALILAQLAHPRVVRYVSHGASADGTPYLVMEWLEGEDLAARLARGRLEVEESVALAASVADTLAFAHGRGVVHRDLKPGNLFLVAGRLDDVKVLDFGIARADRSTGITRPGWLIGTPAYMAPEQARGELHVDARVDVFALGCVLFECLTGEPAFRGDHLAAILAKVRFAETPSARALRPEVPAPLDALLARMLAKEREARPPDGRFAAAALQALGEVSAEPPTEAPAPSTDARELTAGEQRAAAVILVSAPARAERQPLECAPTVNIDADEALLREAARHGGSGERLIDGSLVVVMAGAGVATDLCAQAARCALDLRPHARGRSIALATGRSEQTGRSISAAIDRAAQLAAAAPDAVVLDEVAAGLLDARFEVREGEGLFTLHGERALGEGTRLLLGRATPCVGREKELGLLRALLAETAEEGRAQAALVTAPPGFGKSRLLQELLREQKAQEDAASFWLARGEAQRAGSPFGMLGQALRSAWGVQESEPIETRRAKVRAGVTVRVTDAQRDRVAEFLGEIVGAPFPDDDSLPLRAARRDAQLMADQVRAACLDYLDAACAAGPVIVVLEDLHWGDRFTVQLLDAALRDLGDRPLFVLALARPEVRELFPKLWEGRSMHELRLNQLGRRAAERLARHVLGPDADAPTIARLVALSEGNAFYLEELIRWTAEGRGHELPATVVTMVESRLSALDDEARRLLRAASVFGEEFCKRETNSTRKNNIEQFRAVSGYARHGRRSAGGGRGRCVRAIGGARAVLVVADHRGRGFGTRCAWGRSYGGAEPDVGSFHRAPLRLQKAGPPSRVCRTRPSLVASAGVQAARRGPPLPRWPRRSNTAGGQRRDRALDPCAVPLRSPEYRTR
ncbi:protein kinase [Sorangium sp. So ce185]|uniref:serine/threonine-protein kinase n=1 Tax=Sorangium sp. So ce185 TaxID=3133287 RepID=UPI003F618716